MKKPADNSSQKGSVAIIVALIGIGVLTLGIFAGKKLVSQGPRLSPLAITTTPSPIKSPTPTPSISESPTPFLMCTPPPCQNGEIYFCPGNCPGGCGTICATPTPTPTVNPMCVYCETDADCQTGYYCTEEKYCRPSCLNAEPPCLMPEPVCPSITPSPTTNPDLIPGDANEDKTVDGTDYVVWLNHYNQETGNKHKDGDFDGNGIVDGLDYVMWLNQYFVFHPKPTCVLPPPCIYGIKQPDGTVIYCDPPPNVIYCPLSPTPTCVLPPPCIYGIKQPDGTVIYCDPPPNVIYCPLSPTPTCTPRPACLDQVPACKIPETPDMCPPATNLP